MMAGAPLASKTVQSGGTPWVNKAMSAAQGIGKGIAIVQGVREAAPVVMGAIRTAGSLLPYLAAL